MKDNIVFVYYKKDKKVKVLAIDEAKIQNDLLLEKGYKLTATIDACIWIAYLVNEVKQHNLADYVNGLTPPPK